MALQIAARATGVGGGGAGLTGGGGRRAGTRRAGREVTVGHRAEARGGATPPERRRGDPRPRGRVICTEAAAETTAPARTPTGEGKAGRGDARAPGRGPPFGVRLREDGPAAEGHPEPPGPRLRTRVTQRLIHPRWPLPTYSVGAQRWGSVFVPQAGLVTLEITCDMIWGIKRTRLRHSAVIS